MKKLAYLMIVNGSGTISLEISDFKGDKILFTGTIDPIKGRNARGMINIKNLL